MPRLPLQKTAQIDVKQGRQFLPKAMSTQAAAKADVIAGASTSGKNQQTPVDFRPALCTQKLIMMPKSILTNPECRTAVTRVKAIFQLMPGEMAIDATVLPKPPMIMLFWPQELCGECFQ
jgi:hypothetical protein